MRLCLLIISTAILIKFHQLLKYEIDKQNNNRHSKVDWGVEGANPGLSSSGQSLQN